MNDGGRIAYQGFEYQIRASVWLVLEFLLGDQAPAEVQIEAPTGDDVTFVRQHPTSDKRDVAVGLKMPLVVVQVKGRRHGGWPPGVVLDVLHRRKSRRRQDEFGEQADDGDNDEAAGDDSVEPKPDSPLATLTAQPEARFLFVTDGSISAVLRSFETNETRFRHERLERKGLTKGWEAVPDGVARRIGIMQKCTPEAVFQRADRLLEARLHVPQVGRADCIEAIAGVIRDAILEDGKPGITLDVIRDIATRHHGCPRGPRVFVAPEQFQDAAARLDENHIVILTGESGIGKTTTADQLAFRYRTAPKPYRVVRTRSATELRSLANADGPTVTIVDDPFGQYEEDALARECFGVLADFCAKVRQDRKLIVTSRESFIHPLLRVDAARPDAAAERLRPHRIALSDSSYDRAGLLAEHVRAAGERADWLIPHSAKIVAAIHRPLSYSVLVSRACTYDRRDKETLASLLRDAKLEDLGRELTQTLRDKPAEILMGVAAVWLLLASESAPTFAALELVEDDLRSLRAEVTSAAELLARHGWLSKEGDRLLVLPTYLEAIRDALEARRVLRALVVECAVDAAASRDSEEAVLSMLGVSRRVVRFAPDARKRLTPHIRRWLTRGKVPSRLINQGSESEHFLQLLRVAATHAESGDPVRLVASALIAGQSRRRSRWQTGFEHWSLPKWEGSTYEQLAADGDVRTITRKFVRLGFPGSPDILSNGADALVAFLYRLADVSLEFDDLLKDIEDFSYFHTDIVALGAARSVNAVHDEIVTRAVAMAKRAHDGFVEARFDNEDSQAYKEHLIDSFHEQLKPATALVDAILAVRAERGEPAWAARRSEELVFERFAYRIEQHHETDPSTIMQVFGSCPPDARASFVRALARAKDEALFELATECMLSTPVKAWPDLIAEHILIRLEENEVGERVSMVVRAVVPVLRTLAPVDRVRLAFELGHRGISSEISDPVLTACTSAEREAVATIAGQSVNCGPDGRALLRLLADEEDVTSPVALNALALLPEDIEPWLTKWIEPTIPETLALAAVSAIPTSEVHRANQLLRRALTHSSASVRKRALKILRSIAHDEETTLAIVSLAVGEGRDKTPSVRISTAWALAQDGSPLAEQTLVQLLHDATDTSEATQHGHPDADDVEHGVALAAARVLAARAPVHKPPAESLEEFLRSGRPTARDVMVRGILEALLGRGDRRRGGG